MNVKTKFLLSLIGVGLLTSGIIDYLTNFEENGCEMTWMYQWPEYLDVNLGKEIKAEFPKYELYIYGEGNYARQISKLKLEGIPVLFIPGNAGSYKQVRSLASVALRKAEHTSFHFNYFTVNLQEELGGLYGGVLQEQTEFVHACIKKILGFYKSARFPPTSVILVGHSMGGIIARALFILPDFDPHLVNTIITQATPHQAPAVSIDSDLVHFYKNVNSFWYLHGNQSLSHVTIVSTGGGYRDVLVRNGLTSLHRILPDDRVVSTSSTAVPHAWVSTDHLCAVWCRQMVLATKRAMFDIIDPKSKQVTDDISRRMSVFRHHFLSHTGSKTFIEHFSREITLDSKIPWEEQTGTIFTFKTNTMPRSKYFAIPILSEGVDSVMILSNVTNDNWVCVCTKKEHEDRCSTCINLSHRSQVLPPQYSSKKVIRMYLNEMENASHIVIIVPASKQMVEITVEQYSMITRHLLYTLPNIADTIVSYPVSVFDMAAMLRIQNNSVYYSLHLGGLVGPMRSYIAELTPRNCRKVHTNDFDGNILTLNVPWANESTYKFGKFREKITLSIKLQSAKPAEYDTHAVHLEMYLHPSCYYQLKLKASMSEVMGQLVRFYGVLFPVFLVGVLFLALHGCFLAFATGKPVDSPAQVIWQYGRPYFVLPFVFILRFIQSFPSTSNVLSSLPRDDKEFLEDQDLWFSALPFILFVLAFCVTYCHCLLVDFKTYIFSRVLAALFSWLPEWMISPGKYLIIACGLLAVTSSLTLCGATGILISFVLIMIKLLRLYRVSSVTRLREDRAKLAYFFLILMLCMWLMALNIPSLLMWVKSLKYNLRLYPDPSRTAGVILPIMTILILVDDSIYNLNEILCQASGWLILIVTVISQIYSMVSLYRLPYMIIAVIFITIIPKAWKIITDLMNPEKRKDE
ncbi:GPI inositol-deacylase-like [Gigantopelta aegis]|uniref:GPI inositol-deacylase-like n=1 Tax=Gigantopelta aegis TaxID=1735272 RepID=UPI001B88D16A|nr:GPI inositol-deacylase-like [Gigantopelta aegis]